MKINNNLIFIVVFLMISCGEAPLTPEEQVAQDEANDTRAKILMTMTDDLSLTISITNFSNVSLIKFDLLYNYTIFTPAANITNGNFNPPPTTNPDEHNQILQFIFQSNISGEGDLVNIKFSGANYNDTVIQLSNVIIYDSNQAAIYMTCTNPTFSDPQVCYNNGHSWKGDSEEFYAKKICYINGHSSIEEGEEFWNDYGDYMWTNSYCDIISPTWE